MRGRLIPEKSLFITLSILFITAATFTSALASDVEALKAQRQIVTMYLQNGQIDQAKVALAELQQSYSSLPEYVKEVHELGWEFVKAGRYDTALQIYQDLQQQFPNHERAVWLQRSVVQTYLEEGDIEKITQAVEKLKTDFQWHPDYDHR